MDEPTRTEIRARQKSMLVDIIKEIHETTQGEIEFKVTEPGLGTVLDAPGYPIVFTVDVKQGFVDPKMRTTGYNVTGNIGECMAFVNGCRALLMILASMSGGYQAEYNQETTKEA